MTPDEIRGLMGGYATGSLTASERKALFEAALDDQDLFDELMREQALKEALEQPGAKQRLISTLVRPKPGWKRLWVWAVPGVALAAILVGLLWKPSPKPVELARVETQAPAVPLAQPAQPAQSLPTPQEPSEQKQAPALRQPKAKAERSAVGSLQPPPAAKTEATVAKAEAPAPSVAEATPAPSPPPAPPAQADAFQVNGAIRSLAEGTAPVGGGGGAGRGGVGGFAGANRAVIRPQAAVVPARFAFDYSVTPDGTLKITAAANGFLTVGANNGTTIAAMVTGRALQAGTTTEIPLPPDATSAIVIFSAQDRPAGLSNMITGAGDPPAGTKSDPEPSADSRLIAVIPVRR